MHNVIPMVETHVFEVLEEIILFCPSKNIVPTKNIVSKTALSTESMACMHWLQNYKQSTELQCMVSKKHENFKVND